MKQDGEIHLIGRRYWFWFAGLIFGPFSTHNLAEAELQDLKEMDDDHAAHAPV